MILGACSRRPSREPFPGSQSETASQANALTTQAVLGGFDPRNNHLPGAEATLRTVMNWAAPQAESIRGMIKLGPKVILKEGMFLFITAKKSGAPDVVALIRQRSVEFPYPFVLSKSNALRGPAFSGELQLTVRLKQDSNLMTPNKGDSFATLTTNVGASNLEIVLDQQIAEDASN